MTHKYNIIHSFETHKMIVILMCEHKHDLGEAWMT